MPMEQFQRIQEVVTYWWERLSTQFEWPKCFPTLVIYYYHEGGYYRQHARPDEFIKNNSKVICEAFQKKINKLQQSSDWSGVQEEIRKQMECYQHDNEKWEALGRLLNGGVREQDLTHICTIMNEFKVKNFPLKTILINPGFRNYMVYYAEVDNSRIVRKAPIERGVIRNTWESVPPPPRLSDPEFLFFDLLERPLLFLDHPIAHAYILPLWDQVGHLGITALFSRDRELEDDVLQEFVYVTATQMIPELRSALEFEAQIALMKKENIDALSRGGPDAATALREILWFIQDVEEVTLNQNGFSIPYRDDRQLNVNRDLSERRGDSTGKDPILESRWREIMRLGVVFQQRREALKKARSTAVAGILARNMDHNIESHVTPRATVEEIRKRMRELGIPESLEIIQVLKGRLDGYCQKRADFLAEVTTEPMTTTKPALFYRGVILPFIENVLLMDNLARNEGIGYRDRTSNRLRLRVFINDWELKAIYRCTTDPNSTQYAYPEEFPYSGHCIGCRWSLGTENHSETPSLVSPVCIENGDGDRDVEIELPGPVGEQAFYGFLENVIRNAAKHNRERFDTNPHEDLEISIALSEPEDKHERTEYYVVEVWDNVTDPDKPVGDGKKLVDQVRGYIQSDIIDEHGERKFQAWGIAEMKIAAALLRGSQDFLRMRDFLEVCSEERKATEHKDGSYRSICRKRLVYRFRLMKAKKLCAVLPGWNDEGKSQELRNQGIWVFPSVEELRQALRPEDAGAGKAVRSAASFRFAVFDCSGEDGQAIMNQVKELLPSLPFRIVVLVDPKNAQQLDLPKGVFAVPKTSDSRPPDLGWLWEHWLGRWICGENRPAALEIYLDQGRKEPPTSKWVTHARTFNRQPSRLALGRSRTAYIRIWGRQDSGHVGPCVRLPLRTLSRPHVVFDRHGGVADGLEGLQAGERDTYLLLDKLCPDFVDIFQPVFPQDGQTWIFPWELLEAGFLRILVIDERIAERAHDEFNGRDEMKVAPVVGASSGIPTRWHFAWAAKVYICTHLGVNGDPSPLHRAVEGRVPFLKVRLDYKQEGNEGYTLEKIELDGIVNNEKSINSLEVDMVIIHQGILDGIKDRDPNFSPKHFLRALQRRIPFVIVDSGRGIPPTLFEEVKFLPFSILSHCLLGRRIAKYRLTQVSMSLTRKRGQNRWPGEY